MSESILEVLKIKNEFPMLFIGSGISKRYLKDFPSWDGLLESFWKEIDDRNFYGQMNIVRAEVSKEYSTLNSRDVDYYTNIEVSTRISNIYNRKFNEGTLTIENFSPEDSYSMGIEPFKMGITNKFQSYIIRPEMLGEVEFFKKALTKTQIMITTNYDTFIEDCYNDVSQYGVKTYIGQSGFFEQTIGYAELYKIHGCVNKPQSIVIKGEDYEYFNRNSILISAKIISMLIHSPIIFMGYSLTDLNVRKFIKDFASSLNSEDPVELEKRLIIIEWAKDEQQLKEEVVYDQELNCKFTVVKTDNYKLVYEHLSMIDQGIAPSEIRKFQHVIKRLVVDTGKEGALKSVLLSPVELEELEQKLFETGKMDEKIVVALGDSKVIFQIPNKLTYLEDYILEKNELTMDVMLRFLANETVSGRYPFIKYVNEVSITNSSLHDYEKEKLRQRLENHGNLQVQIESIPVSYQVKMDKLEDIISSNFVKGREYAVIAYNIERLKFEDVEQYVQEKVRELIALGEAKIDTHFRRLMLVYDLRKNKRSDA